MKILFLGTHNAESKKTRLASLLVDDVLALDMGCLTSELAFEDQKGIKSILLSHAHYDHIRGIPCLAFNNSTNQSKHNPQVFGTTETLQILQTHLIDGIIYPEFAKSNSYLGKPALELKIIEQRQTTSIGDYKVTAYPVHHPIEAVGFHISNGNGKSLFYTGDTGPGLSDLWPHISPQVLIADTTYPSRMEKVALEAGHLCPATLKKELIEFRRVKGYLPQVIIVHRSPDLEQEIRADIKAVEKELGITISMPSEGEVFTF